MIETEVGVLNVPELDALASLNADLADHYQAIAGDATAEPESRQIAQALAAWRRARARYFSEQSAEAEAVEAAREPCPSGTPAAASCATLCRSRGC
jgi:chromatin segregation and condensation protein Rec8/ScpA/Scc1 (kleisin family)